MQQPFATVDGSVYDRGPMEEWIQRCRQNNSPPTSPLTGLELPNLTLLLVPALKAAIETYLQHRPELKEQRPTVRSIHEAALSLEHDLGLKRAADNSLEEESDRPQRKLAESEAICKSLIDDLARAQNEIRSLKEGTICSDRVASEVAIGTGQDNASGIDSVQSQGGLCQTMSIRSKIFCSMLL